MYIFICSVFIYVVISVYFGFFAFFITCLISWLFILFRLLLNRNKDKPKIFVDWPESLIIEVLECLSRCPLHTNTAPATKVSVSEDISQNKFSFG